MAAELVIDETSYEDQASIRFTIQKVYIKYTVLYIFIGMEIPF